MLGRESRAGLDLACSLVFDRALFPGYINRKALHRKSFPCHDAQIYVFKFNGNATPEWVHKKCQALNVSSMQALREEVARALRRIEAITRNKAAANRKKKRKREA